MEIKIQCYCGTKYKFDVEPVNHRVPFAVKCPACGADATDFANRHVQQTLGVAVPAAPVAAASGAPAPAAAASPPPAASAPPEPKLRVRMHAPAPAPAPAATPPPSPPPAAPRRAAAPRAANYAPDGDEGFTPRFLLGLLGAVLGALVGCVIWYVIVHATGKQFRLLAVVVGFTAGMGAKLLSKDEGSSHLGGLTALFTLVGIVLTAYFIGRERAHSFADGIEGSIYQEQVAYAKRAVQAVPTGTDEEIRLFLAKEDALEGETPNPAAVSAAEVQRFRDVQLGQYRELASGKVQEADYFKTQRRWIHEEQVAEARRTLAAMPNETDVQIRAYLAQTYAEEGEKPDLKAITAADIQTFRSEVLPELKALASGQRPFEDKPEDDIKPREVLEEVEADAGPWMKFVYFLAGWGVGGVGIIFLTLGLAYKVSTHA